MLYENKRINRRKPPWITNNISNAQKKLARKYKKYKDRGFPFTMKNEIDTLRKNYTDLVKNSKDNYLKSLGKKFFLQNAALKNIGAY